MFQDTVKQWSINSCFLRLLDKQNAAWFSLFFFFYSPLFCNNWKFWAKKKNFTDNQTANTIQLLVAKKRRS